MNGPVLVTLLLVGLQLCMAAEQANVDPRIYRNCLVCVGNDFQWSTTLRECGKGKEYGIYTVNRCKKEGDAYTSAADPDWDGKAEQIAEIEKLQASAKVTELNAGNWPAVVGNKKKDVIVLFTVKYDWCTECKNMMLPFLQSAVQFKRERSVVFAIIDGQAEQEVSTIHKVDAFPTLLLFPKDKKEEGVRYNGPLGAKELFAFVNEVAKTKAKAPSAPKAKKGKHKTNRSPVVSIDDSNFSKVVLDPKKDVLVEFYAPWCGHCKMLAPEYEQVAFKFRNEKNVVVAKLDANDLKHLAAKYQVQGFPTLKFFSKGKGKEPEEFAGARSQRGIITYLNEKTGSNIAAPPASEDEAAAEAPSSVTVLTETNFPQLALDPSKDVLVEFYAPWCGHCKQLAPIYDQLAQAYEAFPDVVIAKVDATAEPSLGTKYEVTGYPTLKFFGKESKDPPLAYEGGRDLDSFITYLNEKNGAAAEAPLMDEAQDPNSNVYILSDKNFDEIVKDTSKDVLVEFYAPWCGHCKMLTPTYEDLAGEYATRDDIVIAKVDATKHKKAASAYDVKGFPTLKWFPKSNKDGVEYSSGRDFDSFVEFIGKP